MKMSIRNDDELETLRQELDVAKTRAAAAEERVGTAEALAGALAERAEAAEERVGTAEALAGALAERAEAAEERSGNTDFPVFLELCHKLLSKDLLVQSDRSLTTKGSITNPKGKKYPSRLRLWDDFPQQQQRYFDVAYSLLYPSDRNPPTAFASRSAIEDLGRILYRRPLASEKDLESYERFAVEEKVKDILGQLMSIPEAQPLLNGCKELEFENHLNSLSENAEDVLERQKRSRIDQACVFRNIDGNRSLSFVREYKAPHKLTVEYLRAGLRHMDVREDVVQRLTIPQESEEKLNYNADRLVASAVTQTFEYMIDNGLEYSSIATGVAEVYLRIDEDDPETVCYYLAEPRLDVGDADEFGFRYPFTAIGRLLAFTLMAMHSPQRSQAWRSEATQSLHVWNEDFEDVLHKISPEERRATPPSSVYKPPTYPVDVGSPCLTRKRALASLGEVVNLSFQSTSSSSEGSGYEAHRPTAAFQTPSRHGGPAKRKRTSTQGTAGRNESRQFCTHKCLLGLKRGQRLDPACPNVEQHRRRCEDRFHHLDLRSFNQLLHLQLVADMDCNCQPLGKQGARGALFKVTLSSHGYTFVAKGTVEAFVVDLRHEGSIYDWLQSLQGSAIPVYLGNIDLERTYFLDVGVKIIHMMFMSWGGHNLYEQTPSAPPARLEQEKQRSMSEIRRLGVLHKDKRLANMLWDESQQRVLLIDFERSAFQAVKRPKDSIEVLQELSPNKKRRIHAKESLDANLSNPLSLVEAPDMVETMQ